MYNLSVAQAHTYYVGGGQWLVHNCGNYRDTFFEAHPELKGQVFVHHGIEQQTLKRYPALFTEAEIHDISNLRGIPNMYNNDIHLSQIRRAWDGFYEKFDDLGRAPTKQEVLDFRGNLDKQFGKYFAPVVK